MDTHHSLTTNPGADSGADSGADIDEQHSMDAVRDLLFGKKTREIGDQIAAIEERLNRSMKDLERRIGSRFESLEQFVRGEISSAGERFEREQTQLEKRTAETGEKFLSLSEALDQRFSQLETHIGRIESDVRSQLHDRGKALADEIEESSRRLEDTVKQDIESLRQNTARRNEMGEILIELGMRMTTGDEADSGGEEVEAESGERSDGLPA